MKSIIASLVVAFALSVSVHAETDYKALAVIKDIQNGADNMNQIKVLRVKESVTLPDDSVDAAEIGTIAQTYTGTNAITATQFTPSFVGQFLIGTVSNTVHVSENLTTNGWIQIKP